MVFCPSVLFFFACVSVVGIFSYEAVAHDCRIAKFYVNKYSVILLYESYSILHRLVS